MLLYNHHTSSGMHNTKCEIAKFDALVNKTYVWQLIKIKTEPLHEKKNLCIFVTNVKSYDSDKTEKNYYLI